MEVTNYRHLQTLVNVPLEKCDVQVKGSTRIQIPTRFTFNRLRVLGAICHCYHRVEEDIIPIVSSCPHVYKLHLNLMINKLPKVNQFSPNLVKLTLRFTELKRRPHGNTREVTQLKNPPSCLQCIHREDCFVLKEDFLYFNLLSFLI